MKNLILLPFILLCFSTALFAQKVGDTIYYDAKWKTIKTKDGAQYFRTIDKKAKGISYVTDHFANGKPQMTGSYSSFEPEVRDGEFVFYNEDGKLSSDKVYKDNKLNGSYKDFYPNGQLHFEGNYVNDVLNGDFKSYYAIGQIKRIETYKNGDALYGKSFTLSGTDTTYRPYMVSPMFKGGQDSLDNYLVKHLAYPPEARRKNITGRVMITFVVSKTGELTDVHVVKGVDPLLDDAAVAIVKTMPTWNPGTVDDVPQRFQYSVPIKFSLR